jgi:prepilin-type N-terminal cleavage/methylation domain-containing protein
MMREQDHRNISPATGLLDQRGFTLLELVVVMGLFITLMMITANSFNRIALQSSQQSKSLESQIEGIVGLEVLRADLEQAGFGLPWSFQNSLTYSESSLDSSYPDSNYWETGSPDSFNDAAVGGGNPPRAIQSGNTKFNLDSASKGAKYVVIKSLNLGTNETVKKWTNLSIDQSGARTLKIWGAASRDFTPDERLIVVRNSMTTTPPTRELVMSGTSFSTRFSNYSTFVKDVPNNSTLQVYGVAPATSPGSDQVRMPFNRADYYVVRKASDMPASCAPNTGILYKSTISHVDGRYDKVLPLLDCVADFQIVYGLDTDGAGRINLHADTIPVTMTATEIRDQVREIRAYVLAQDGHRDPFYTYPSTTVDVGESFDGGSTLMGRRFTLSSDMLNYRWKVYTIVVRPKNLISN